MSKNYLIIGGAGFIGCNFANHLLERGDNVTVLDNFSRRGAEENVTWLSDRYAGVRAVRADIRSDQDILLREIEEHDIVHHLAGQVAVTSSVVNPREDFEINVVGTFNILEAVRASGRRPLLVYASTNKVYGGMEDVVIEDTGQRYEYRDLPDGVSETRGLDFHSPYGCSKGTGDQYVRDYSRIYDLQTVVMRQSCIYGPRQFGIEDQGWVAWFTIAAVLGRPISVYGDGKQIRDVLHVDDLFTAWDLTEKNIDTTSGDIFNIGGGPGMTMSLLELLEILGEVTGAPIPVTYGDWRPGDQRVYVSDIAKASNTFGWQPKIAPRDGVKSLHAWVVENREMLESVL